jgi:hypothetical protein
LGCPSLPGVRLDMWTILAVVKTILSVVNWCFGPMLKIMGAGGSTVQVAVEPGTN